MISEEAQVRVDVAKTREIHSSPSSMEKQVGRNIGFCGKEMSGEKFALCRRLAVADGSLEKRVAQLEIQLAKLQSEFVTAPLREGKDWRRTIGMFTDDPGMKEVFEEAQKIRKADRRKLKNSGRGVSRPAAARQPPGSARHPPGSARRHQRRFFFMVALSVTRTVLAARTISAALGASSC